MIDSPVPYLIGILGDEEFYDNLITTQDLTCEIIFVNSKIVKNRVRIFLFYFIFKG